MANKLTEWLVKPFINEVDLPIKVGDDVLMGRFKNKRVKVKSITYNEKGDLQINGRPALKFRLVQNDKKLLPNKTTNKKSAEPATYYGNWLRQTENVIKNNPEIEFFRVINVGDFCPAQLNNYANIRNIDYTEFQRVLKN